MTLHGTVVLTTGVPVAGAIVLAGQAAPITVQQLDQALVRPAVLVIVEEQGGLGVRIRTEAVACVTSLHYEEDRA